MTSQLTKSGLLTIVAAMGLLLIIALMIRLSALERGQLFEDSPCESCHLAGVETTSSNATMLQGSLEQLCVTCHGGAAEASHPSGVRPTMATPERFPLDWKGDLTCSSCHNVHGSIHGQLRTALRGEAFCTQCHASGFFERMADGGNSLMLSGHLDANVAPAGQLRDTYSIQCMTCHGDQSDAARSQVSVDAFNVVRHRSSSINHPVGVDYLKAARFGGYRPITQLPAEIVLPGGQLSCISCHDAYSAQHGEVVVSQQGSKLCFQCHDL
ncbi:MAG: cytochrome c3 family protein [Halopseudomonas sp.]